MCSSNSRGERLLHLSDILDDIELYIHSESAIFSASNDDKFIKIRALFSTLETILFLACFQRGSVLFDIDFVFILVMYLNYTVI